jgi:hypothetical protein
MQVVHEQVRDDTKHAALADELIRVLHEALENLKVVFVCVCVCVCMLTCVHCTSRRSHLSS